MPSYNQQQINKTKNDPYKEKNERLKREFAIEIPSYVERRNLIGKEEENNLVLFFNEKYKQLSLKEYEKGWWINYDTKIKTFNHEFAFLSSDLFKRMNITLEKKGEKILLPFKWPQNPPLKSIFPDGTPLDSRNNIDFGFSFLSTKGNTLRISINILSLFKEEEINTCEESNGIICIKNNTNQLMGRLFLYEESSSGGSNLLNLFRKNQHLELNLELRIIFGWKKQFIVKYHNNKVTLEPIIGPNSIKY